MVNRHSGTILLKCNEAYFFVIQIYFLPVSSEVGNCADVPVVLSCGSCRFRKIGMSGFVSRLDRIPVGGKRARHKSNIVCQRGYCAVPDF